MSEVDNLLANDHVLVGYVSEEEKKKNVDYVERVHYSREYSNSIYVYTWCFRYNQ